MVCFMEEIDRMVVLWKREVNCVDKSGIVVHTCRWLEVQGQPEIGRLPLRKEKMRGHRLYLGGTGKQIVSLRTA